MHIFYLVENSAVLSQKAATWFLLSQSRSSLLLSRNIGTSIIGCGGLFGGTQDKCWQGFGDASSPAASWAAQHCNSEWACAAQLRCHTSTGTQASAQPTSDGHHEAALLLAGMLTAHQPPQGQGAEQCLMGTADLWGRWAAVPAAAAAPPSPHSASLLTLVNSMRLSKCSWRYHRMDDSLGLSFSVAPHCPNPVLLLLLGLGMPAPSLTSAPGVRQLAGTFRQKHRPLAVQPPVTDKGSQGEQGAIESRMVACVVLKLPLLKDSCLSPYKSNDGCEWFESTVVDGLNHLFQQI